MSSSPITKAIFPEEITLSASPRDLPREYTFYEISLPVKVLALKDNT